MKACFHIAWTAAILLMSCSPGVSVSSAREFSKWLNDDENGCTISKEVNGMILEVKYLPPSFLALKDAEAPGSQGKYDSLLNSYQSSTTFLLTFKPKDQEKGQDIMYKGVANYKEYVERSMTLNFDMETKLKLKTDQAEYAPVLSSLENTYGLSKGRTIYMVFAGKDKKDELITAPYYDLTYEDEIYDLGILHFVFDHSAIQKKLPHINIHHS